jgi:hypothetical protein
LQGQAYFTTARPTTGAIVDAVSASSSDVVHSLRNDVVKAGDKVAATMDSVTPTFRATTI